MKKVLIMGAHSYVGTSVEQYLLQWSERFLVDTVDARDISWKDMDFSKYDCVFHVAGIAHINNRREADKKKQMFHSVNTTLAIETAKKAKEQGVKQFIFMSTANVYGESAPIGKSKVVTKDTPLQKVNYYSSSKIDAEKGILELASAAFKIVILRCPMIYGKNCRGNYNMLAKLATKFPVFPRVENTRSMLYIGNLTEFVRLMVENVEDGIFCPSDKEWFCTSNLVKLIAEVHGKKIRLLPGCNWMLKVLSHMFEAVNKAFGSFAYDESLSVYKEEYRLYSLEKAVRETEGV